jgi:hypothetical protein
LVTNGNPRSKQLTVGVDSRKELKILSDASDGSFLSVVRDEIPVYVKRLSAATFLPELNACRALSPPFVSFGVKHPPR